MGVLRGEFKIQAMYVDVLSEGSRTRVRFPPPPPFLKREALVIQGLFYFGKSKSSVAGASLDNKMCPSRFLDESAYPFPFLFCPTPVEKGSPSSGRRRSIRR